MRRTSLHRKTVLLLLTAILAMPLAATAVPRPERPRPADAREMAPLKLLSRAWSLLWSAWTKEGCNIDPNGRCVQTKAGCNIDPDGRCQGNPAPALEADAGCHIDPNGRCHS